MSLSGNLQNKKDFDPLDSFFEKQLEAIKASEKFKFVLYGGSVGSGKSYWLRWSCLYWLMRLAAESGQTGIRAGLFCEDYPSLNDRHLSKVKFEFPTWLGEWNEQKHEFTLKRRFGGGVLAFRNLNDPSKYLSAEFAIIAIDEINRNPKSVFDFLRTRHRWPGISNVKFLAACNPVGEAWVKNIWVRRIFPPEEKERHEFIFIPALPTDNPYIRSEYFEQLKSLPEFLRKAYLEGDWDAIDQGVDESGYYRLLTDREFQACLTSSGQHGGHLIMGVDPAAGGDNSAIVLKSTVLQEILFNQPLRDTMDLVGLVIDFCNKYRVDVIVVDKTGVGQGVYDRLREAGYNVRGVAFNDKPSDSMFANLKAELYWKERNWLLAGGRLLQNYGWNEFEIVKYKNKDGKIIIQPKEELYRQGISSPNVVDAAVLTQSVSNYSFNVPIVADKFYDQTEKIYNQ